MLFILKSSSLFVEGVSNHCKLYYYLLHIYLARKGDLMLKVLQHIVMFLRKFQFYNVDAKPKANIYQNGCQNLAQESKNKLFYLRCCHRLKTPIIFNQILLSSQKYSSHKDEIQNSAKKYN